MKKWNVMKPEKPIIDKLVLGCSVTSLTAAALASKGYSSPEMVMEKLEAQELSDPFLIADMQKAADKLEQALEEGRRICVYGDYDCDGIMATAILYSYLMEAGADVTYYIPERSEGYGLNKNAIDALSDDGVELIVTVDNGIAAIDEAEYIYILGMELIVTDHHQQGSALPRAEAVVDPHRHDDFSPFKFGCGALIALKLVAAMDGGDYTLALEQFGDLAAIATVADIVSLTGENRFIVQYGLELINNTDRPALIALKEVCGLADKKVSSHSIGFGIGPRINASGRFGSPRTAEKLFLCEDYDEAIVIARELDSLNDQRKEAENQIISQIYQMIEKDPSLVRGRVIFLLGKGWHHGVIGIVASRIQEQFGKPCFIASEENGEIRGSARAFGEFSVFKALTYAGDALSKFGGHTGAGGFTIKEGRSDDFRRLIEEFALKEHPIMPAAEITADAPISAMELTVDNIRGLSALEPFGMGNEKPLFYIENASVIGVAGLSGDAHTKLRIKVGFAQADALIFRRSPQELGFKTGDVCAMIVSPEVNEFRGNTSVSLIVSDIRPQGLEQSKFFAGETAFEKFLRDEELPKNYYPNMLPIRNDAALVYKSIPETGITLDALYIKLAARLNYCKIAVSAEALRELGLIRWSPADGRFFRLKVSHKADLDKAPVLLKLKEVIGRHYSGVRLP
ncbi:MAG: single-stranded-DNA-specific exonuclease RecJ [Ruminococcus sp.]|nr:single-stranded-DNA-specific exonuclease RecJ [Ruminococcus sp.]